MQAPKWALVRRQDWDLPRRLQRPTATGSHTAGTCQSGDAGFVHSPFSLPYSRFWCCCRVFLMRVILLRLLTSVFLLSLPSVLPCLESSRQWRCRAGQHHRSQRVPNLVDGRKVWAEKLVAIRLTRLQHRIIGLIGGAECAGLQIKAQIKREPHML